MALSCVVAASFASAQAQPDARTIGEEKDGRNDVTGKWQVSPEQYERNLDALVRQLKGTGAKLIWASTTPVPEGADPRIKGDEAGANTIAEKIMKKYDVPVNDLYQYMLPVQDKYQQPRNVHFTQEGYDFLAIQVAEKSARHST